MADTWIRFAAGLDERVAARALDPERLLALGEGSHRLATPELGLGELSVRVWEHARLPEYLPARFTRPRSASMAEREWNLLCYARAHGLGTPDPIAVGAERAPLFAERSFLVVSPPRNVVGLEAWMKAKLPGRVRARGAQALLAAVDQVAACGLRLQLRHERELVLSAQQALGVEGAHETGDCSPLGQLPARLTSRAGEALTLESLPSVYVLAFTGARIGSRRAPKRRARELRRHLEKLLRDTVTD